MDYGGGSIRREGLMALISVDFLGESRKQHGWECVMRELEVKDSNTVNRKNKYHGTFTRTRVLWLDINPQLELGFGFTCIER